MRLIDADAFFENFPELAIEPYINAPTVKTSGDLISRSVLKKAYFNAIEKSSIGEVSIVNLIDNAPTVKTFTLLDIEEQYRKGLEKGLSEWETQRPQGEWLYPYSDNIIGKRRIGKSWRVCSNCKESFTNNIPWNANFCPNCGAEVIKNER